MNAFYEHHHDSIQFGYRCFDRILLNGVIRPFEQPERVIGFFNTYREHRRVSRDTLRDIANQFHGWVKNRTSSRTSRHVSPRCSGVACSQRDRPPLRGGGSSY